MSELEKRIEGNVQKMVEDVREYFRSQKDDWQKVPWLALQANGRGGYSTGYTYAYEFGLERITDSVFVDLENGELVCPSYGFNKGNKFEMAKDHSVFPLAYDLEDNSAKEKIKQLAEACQEKDNEFYRGSNFEGTSVEWREFNIKKYGLEKDRYVRRKVE